MNYEKMSVGDLEKELARRDELRLKGQAYNREETVRIMEIRNAKIAEDQCDQWGLSAEEYAAAKAGAEAHKVAEREVEEKEIRLRKLINSTQVVVIEGEKLKDQTEKLNEIKRLREEIPVLRAKAEQLAKEARPLHVHLNRARTKALKEHRLAQTATAKAASVGGKVKPTGS